MIYSSCAKVAYLTIKLGDHLFWMPFYTILPDPTVPGTMPNEESTSYQQVERHCQMYRDWGSAFWAALENQATYNSRTMHQAMIRHFVLDDQMPSIYCNLFDADTVCLANFFGMANFSERDRPEGRLSSAYGAMDRFLTEQAGLIAAIQSSAGTRIPRVTSSRTRLLTCSRIASGSTPRGLAN